MSADVRARRVVEVRGGFSIALLLGAHLLLDGPMGRGLSETGASRA